MKHPFFESRNFPVVVPVGGGTELDVVVERGRVSRDQHMEMLYREMDSRLTFRGMNTAFITREELKGREKMPLDVAIRFAPEFAMKALYILSDVCVFVHGIPRPGAMIKDFAHADIESIELYGAPIRSFLRNRSHAMFEMDPTGSLRDRWPPRAQCGGTLTPSEEKISQTVVKVFFAVIWLKH